MSGMPGNAATTAAELADLIAAAERVCDENSRKSPASTWSGVEWVRDMGSNLLIEELTGGAG